MHIPSEYLGVISFGRISETCGKGVNLKSSDNLASGLENDRVLLRNEKLSELRSTVYPALPSQCCQVTKAQSTFKTGEYKNIIHDFTAHFLLQLLPPNLCNDHRTGTTSTTRTLIVRHTSVERQLYI